MVLKIIIGCLRNRFNSPELINSIKMNTLSRAIRILRNQGVGGLFRAILRKSLPVETYCKLLAIHYRRQGHRGVGDPLQVWEVNPGDINHISTYKGADIFSIKDGDWHRHCKEFEDTYRYRMFSKHFEEGIPWDETIEFRERAAFIREHGSINTLDIPADQQSLDTLREYYEYIDHLYHRISEHGYQRQSALTAEDDFAGRNQHPALGEIQVVIGPDGTIMVISGYHRFTIAKLLELERIPVRTRIRHRSWQKVRDAIFAADDFDALEEKHHYVLNHPEVQDLL